MKKRNVKNCRNSSEENEMVTGKKIIIIKYAFLDHTLKFLRFSKNHQYVLEFYALEKYKVQGGKIILKYVENLWHIKK